MFARTQILVDLPKYPPKFPLLLLQEEGSWRNTCSKTLREENENGWKRERESGKSSSITIAQDMVSWE
jgi:hypothetical protein